MTVVELRSYSLMSGSTSALMQRVVAGAMPGDDLLDPLLVRRVEVGVQQADRDRLDPFGDEKPGGALDAGLVERRVDLALGVDPLVDLDPPAPLDQGRRLGPAHVVEPRHAQIADFEHVAEAARGDQPGLGALVLEDRVRGDRSAVQQLDDAPAADLGEQRGQPVDDGAGIVVDGGRHLLGVALAPIAEQHDIGKGAADIDPGAEGFHALQPFTSHKRGTVFTDSPFASASRSTFSTRAL